MPPEVMEPPHASESSETTGAGEEHVNHVPSQAACTYCGVESAASVVKCERCEKWFCNGKGQLTGSHIVTHLVLSKHNSVMLSESSPLGAETLECYNCGNKNVFVLGFVAAKQDLVVVILCRLPCALQRDINWDINEWQPLLENRSLLPWVSPFPPIDQMAQALPITDGQARMLEAKWRTDQSASLEDFSNSSEPELKLLPVPLRFNDGVTYHNSWVPLIEAEAECDKALKESQALEHSTLLWTEASNGDFLADFILFGHENTNLMVAIGDTIKVRYNSVGSTMVKESWEGEGIIVLRPSAKKESFTASFLRLENPPTHASTGFTVEFMWVGVPYFRMINAVKAFATKSKSLSAYLYHTILGHQVVDVQFKTKIPKELNVLGMISLNDSQKKALTMAIKNPLSLIQGPPGTGKTVTSSAIIYHLSKLQKNKILVCAPLNVAVDHLATKLHSLGLNVVRIYSKAREEVELGYLDCDIRTLAAKKLKFGHKLLKKRESGGGLTPEETNLLDAAFRKAEKLLIENADVVCCTCVGALDKKIKGQFNTVLIDESTQALEAEVLVPLVKGCKQLILVGDHQQLGPVVIEEKAGKAGLSQSLFERLIALGHVPHRLEIQYRMNPVLAEFPSNMFYEGTLQNGVSLEDRTWTGLTFPWPVPRTPMMFWVNYGKEELSANGNSYLNRVEAMNVEKVITRLFQDGIKPDQIGVITPYEGQRAYISNYMTTNTLILEKRAQYEEVEILSVDSFQGREKDFVILSCVRGNEDNNIGFLRDPRRLNVALTRAKYGMVVLGNPAALSRNRLWNRLLVHYREKGCLVEGPLDNLQLSLVQLKESREKDTRSIPKRDFEKHDDLQSMLSYVPDHMDLAFPTAHQAEPAPPMDETMWPQLTKNQVSTLNANYQAVERSDTPKFEDMKNFVDTFSSALNI